MNTCQILILSAIIACGSAVDSFWNGPAAAHSIGQLVEDTPEVAAAKRNHFETYAQVAANLPVLPPDEDYHAHVPQVPQFPTPVVPPFPHFPIDDSTHKPWTGPFADHVSGQQVQDTPEVAAIKQQHLLAYSHIRKALPELPVERIDVHAGHVHHVPQQFGFVPSTTESPYLHEAADAKSEHAKAVAALVGSF